MTSQLGKCNVCATPCSSCVRLGFELLPTGSTSNCFSNEACEHEVTCRQISQTDAVSSLKSGEEILESNDDQNSCTRGAGRSLSVEYHRIDTDKMNESAGSDVVNRSIEQRAPQGHLHGCSMDHMESSSSIIMVKAANEDPKQNVVDSAIKSEFTEDLATKSLNCSNPDRDTIPIEQSNVEQPCPSSDCVKCDDESALLDDVRVCDICGDAGREDSLAVCSKCKDGAEHVYCMRTRLDKVPDSNWMCEECVLLENKMTKTKYEKFVAYKYKSSYESYQGDEILKGPDLKVLRETNTKGLNGDKRKRDKVSSPPSAERTSGDVTSAFMTKRIALGTKTGPCFVSRDSKAPQPQAQDFAIKPGDELPVLNDLFSRTRSIQENVPVPTTSGQHLPKSRPHLMASGKFCKSKSFNDSDKRPKVLCLNEIPRNQFSNDKKVSTVRTMGKSVSFNDASSRRSNVFGPKSKRLSRKFSDDGDLKRLRYMKERSSVEMISNSEFKRPQVGSIKDGSGVSASSRDMKFATPDEIILPDVCGTKYNDPRAVQSARDLATVTEVNKLCSPVPIIIQDLLSPTRSDASQEAKHKDETISHSSLKARMPLSCSGATEKSPQTSNGSGSEHYGVSESLGHASHSHLQYNSSVSVFDMAMVKDSNCNSQTDLGSPFCNQLNAYRTLAVPMFNYIWKGEFEIQISGRLQRILYRIQAHLSTRSSSKIPEAVNRFPDKILLEEVSRLNAWPTQFQEYYPQDDSIGLYFFAEDLKSYGDYRSLLHCMADYDLALRGNLNGIELLIFSSNLLPESSRYWNGLLFLWGVFKERKVNGS